MFEALQVASPLNKYQVAWAELSPVQLQGVIPKWFEQLAKSSLASGPQKAQRMALADEFYRLLHIQKQILAGEPGSGAATPAVQRAQVNIDWFATEYKKKFATPLKPPPIEETGLKALIERQGMQTSKLQLLDMKLQLVNFWLRGTKQFPEHKAGGSLLFQYMGNAPKDKVRLFLEVLCSDADKAVKLKDPGMFKTSFETQRGLKTVGDGGKLYKVEWTDAAFRKAIKAEVGASYGVAASGSCELEFKGIKAKLEAEAWAGARASASGEAAWSVGSGVTLKGSVEAEIGIKLTAGAKLDCADIFLCEASAEAFAGAMAKCEVEITATVNGVKAKVGAEAFAGARLSGKASMTLKIQGYEIVGAEATGSLTAGIGAKFGLEFQSSVFGDSSLTIEAGTTFGVGAEAATKFSVNASNVGPAMHSLYFTGYLGLLGRKKEKHAYTQYFREIEDNARLFEKARGVIEDQMKIVILERNRLFSESSAWKQLEGLAAFRSTGTL